MESPHVQVLLEKGVTFSSPAPSDRTADTDTTAQSFAGGESAVAFLQLYIHVKLALPISCRP